MGFFSDMFYNTFDPKYGFLGRPASGALRSAIDFGSSLDPFKHGANLAASLGVPGAEELYQDRLKQEAEGKRLLDEFLGSGFKEKMLDEPVSQAAGLEEPVNFGELFKNAVMPYSGAGDIGQTITEQIMTPSGPIPRTRDITPEEVDTAVSGREQLGGAVESVADIATDPMNLAIPAIPRAGMAFLPGIAESLGTNLGTGEYGKALVDALFGGLVGAHTTPQFRGGPKLSLSPEKVGQPKVPEGGYRVPEELGAEAAAPFKDVDLEALMAPERAKISEAQTFDTRLTNMATSFVDRIKEEASRLLGDETVRDVKVVAANVKGGGGAQFDRSTNTMYLDPVKLGDKTAEEVVNDVLHELAHTKEYHDFGEGVAKDLAVESPVAARAIRKAGGTGEIRISPETVAEVAPEMITHTDPNIDLRAAVSPTEHQFQTGRDILLNSPEIRAIGEEFSGNLKPLLTEEFARRRGLPPAESVEYIPELAAPPRKIRFYETEEGKWTRTPTKGRYFDVDESSRAGQLGKQGEELAVGFEEGQLPRGYIDSARSPVTPERIKQLESEGKLDSEFSRLWQEGDKEGARAIADYLANTVKPEGAAPPKKPSAEDPVVKFTDSKRLKYGDDWASKLSDDEKNVYNSLLKGEGEFTAVEDVGAKLEDLSPRERAQVRAEEQQRFEEQTKLDEEVADLSLKRSEEVLQKLETPLEQARKAVTADKPIVKWRVTFNDGNTVLVDAPNRGSAAQIARRDFAEGRKVAGISESSPSAVSGEKRSDIQEKQSTYVVTLSDGTSRTTRAYSESQARNVVEKPLKAIGSDLTVTGIHIREKGEATSPTARRTGGEIPITTTSTGQGKSTTRTTGEVIRTTRPEPARTPEKPTTEPVTEPTPEVTPKKYDPWKKEEKAPEVVTAPEEAPKGQKIWVDPKYKHTWKVTKVEGEVAYLERSDGGKIKRRTIYASELETGKPTPPGTKAPEPVTLIKGDQLEAVTEPGEKPAPKKPTKEQVPVPDKGIPDEVVSDTDFIAMMKEKGYTRDENAYSGFTKKGNPVGASEVWARWREYDRAGDLIDRKVRQKAQDELDAELEAINQKIVKQADRDVWEEGVREARSLKDYSKLVDKIEREQGAEEASKVRALVRAAEKEERETFKAEEALRKAQTKEKFKKEAYNITFSNGRTVTVRARSEKAAREYALNQAKKLKPGITVSAVSKKPSALEAAITGVSKKVEESGILKTPLAKFLGTIKSIAFGGDVGHLLRQGKQMNADLLFSKHAKKVLDQFPVIFKAMKSQEFFDEYHKNLYADPDVKMMVDNFNLDMPGLGEHLREEVFHGSPAENIPLVGKYYAKPSERAYTAGLNFLRAAEAKKWVGSLRKKGFTPENAPEKFAAVSRAINIISQRGDFNPAYQKVFSDASLVYGAPRAKGARLQNFVELFKGGTSPEIARLTAAKTIAFNAGMLGLLKMTTGGEFITDPERSDYLKFRINDKISVDPWVGLGVTARTIAKIFTGKSVSPYSNKVRTVAPGEAIGNEITSGLAPGVKLLVEGIFGKDTRGYQVDRIKSLLNVTPLTARNIVELLNSGDTEDAFLLAMLQAGGEGVDVFDYEAAREEEHRLKEERGIPTGRSKRRSSPSW